MRPLPALLARLRPPVIPLVRITGVLGPGLRPGAAVTLRALERPLRTAFALRRAPAVALVISSPGGAPAQAELIAHRIRTLADRHRRTVLAFVEDVAASGGYWIACAADEIVAAPTSLVGSVGVVTTGFGLHEFLARHGIERRVHARGPLKDFLDPFRPEDPAHVAVLEELQADLHESFLAWVRSRRGTRLAVDEETLASGRLWTGRRAHALGLVDHLGDVESFLRERYGPRVRLRPLPAGRPPWPLGWLERGVTLFAERLVEAVLLRLGWARPPQLSLPLSRPRPSPRWGSRWREGIRCSASRSARSSSPCW